MPRFKVGEEVYIRSEDCNGTVTEVDIDGTYEVRDAEGFYSEYEVNELRKVTQTNKGNDMSFNKTKETVNGAGSAIMDETVDVAKLNVGKVVYSNLRGVAERFLPTVSWYEKLFMSKEKRALAELLAVYGILHLVKTKYSHYVLDAVTMYINLELQTKLIGSIDVSELENIFALPKAK